jgi:hypothetical protein
MGRILYLLSILFFVAVLLYKVYSQTVGAYYINITSMYNTTVGSLTNITSLPPNVIFQPFNVSYDSNQWQYYPNDTLFIIWTNISIDPGAYQILSQNNGSIYLAISASGPFYVWVNTNNVRNTTYACPAGVPSCSDSFPLKLVPGTNTIYIIAQNQGSSPTIRFAYTIYYATYNKPYVTYPSPFGFDVVSYSPFYLHVTNDVNYSFGILNYTYPKNIYQIDLIAQITNYTVTTTNTSKTVNALLTVSGSFKIPILLYTFLVDSNGSILNISDYRPNIIINGVNYGNTNYVALGFLPYQTVYNIQITDNYPQYKTAIAIFTWNPNQNFVYLYGVPMPLGKYSYEIGTPTLTSHTQSERFFYALPLYIFPHNSVIDGIFALLLDGKYIQQTYGIKISPNNFIIMQYNPGLNTFQILPYFFDNVFYQTYGSPLIFVKIPRVTSMIPIILYLFVTNNTYSDFSQPSSVFSYFVNLQESGYYSLLNLYTNGTVTYQQTPIGLQITLSGGQLGFYIS